MEEKRIDNNEIENKEINEENNNVNDENKNIQLESQITNNINNINIVNMIIEKDKRKTSDDTYETKIVKPRKRSTLDKNIENKFNLSNICNKKINYIYQNKIASKSINEHYMTDYNVDITSIKKFINFQNKNIKKEKDEIETNKYLYAYKNMYPEDKINPIFFYIIKNYQKDKKINQEILKNILPEKFTPKKNIEDNELENSKINTAETLKNNFNAKIKENNNNFKKNIEKEENENNNTKFNTHKTSIKYKKAKKEHLHFNNDEELVTFVKNKFKEKNSYYLVELKNRSYITNCGENNETKSKENTDFFKLKDENNKIRSKNIKLKKEYEQIEKELKLITDKNKELKEEMIKKDSLIKKYEKKINENKNQIQSLKKSLSENINNKNKENKKNNICKREIEFFLIKKTGINKIKKILCFKEIKIDKIINFYFEKKTLKNSNSFTDNLSIINSQKFYILNNYNTDIRNKKFALLSITNENNICILNKDINNKEKKININLDIINNQTINFIGVKGTNKFNSNIFKENIINFNFICSVKKELNKKNDKFMNIEKIQNIEYVCKGIPIKNQIFEIHKNLDIYFEKIKKTETKSFKQNLSLVSIDIIYLSKINHKKSKENFIINSESFCFVGAEKIFGIKYLSKEIIKNLEFKIIHNKKDINKILSIEKSNLSIIKEFKSNKNLFISKNEIIYYVSTKLNFKNILKSIQTEGFSYISIIKINKFKNIEISKINISFDFNKKNKKDISKINKIETKENNEKLQIPNKNQENLNNTKINTQNSVNIEINKFKLEEKEELKAKKNEKSDKLSRAMNRIKKKNQSIVISNSGNSELSKSVCQIYTKGRSDTVRYAKSGKIMDIAKQLERQIGKGENEKEEKTKENKNENENTNIVDIISTQPIIKKKKRNKINFIYDD